MGHESAFSVLIVEDDPSYQFNYSELLEDEGHDVAIASTLQEAERLLQSRTFDLAIVDIRLDDHDEANKDGLLFIAKIEKLQPDLRVIVTSGYGDTIQIPMHAVRNERILDFYDKNEVQPSRLLNTIYEFQGRRRAEKEGLSESIPLLREIIGRMVRDQLSLSDIATFILEKAARLIDSAHGNLLIVEGNELVVVATTDGEPGDRLKIDECISGLAVRNRSTVNVPDVDAAPFVALFLPALGRDKSSELAVPAMIADEVIAVLNFESRDKNAFTRAHEKQVEVLAESVAIAIDNARAHESVILQANRLTKLSRFAGLINSTVQAGADQVADAAVTHMLELMECDKAAIFLLDRDKSALALTAHRGLSQGYVQDAAHLPVESVRAGVIRTLQTLKIVDINTDERFGSVREIASQEDYRALFETPLDADSEVLGTFVVYYSRPRQLSQTDENLARTFARHVSIALLNARQYDALRLARTRERLALLGELSGDIVHRMTNPFSAIKLNVQLIEQDNPSLTEQNPGLAKKLDRIVRISEQAMMTVDDMKKRARDHRSETDWQLVDIAEKVEAVLSRTEIPEQVRVEKNIEPNLPLVRASKQLEAVLRNLIENAINSMFLPRCSECRQFLFGANMASTDHHGGTNGSTNPLQLSITVRASQVNEQQYLEVLIEDAGCGIPDEWRGEVTQAYFTTHADASSAHGLGLWYSEIYIDAIGGSLQLDQSQSHQGTIATLRLPSAE